ncbi:hypothetical protein [Ruegeria sp.]|uniref:hypothetical protein n=1 Tax=Ruegeria sp. TaxID=1879320 RepID=UPI0023093A13|nr:hypothetical protein [Ruegeria sp.]MDA7966492.1 hypothetical protein [Ruegeria sp.]
MSFRLALVAVFAGLLPVGTQAQSVQDAPSSLFVELNTVEDIDGGCRFTFVARNGTGQAIDTAMFEAVVFDSSDRVATLSLFNFRELPVDRVRVRQFRIPDLSCSNVGQVLINGVNRCVVGGAESEICSDALSLSSRTEMELLG